MPRGVFRPTRILLLRLCNTCTSTHLNVRSQGLRSHRDTGGRTVKQRLQRIQCEHFQLILCVPLYCVVRHRSKSQIPLR